MIKRILGRKLKKLLSMQTLFVVLNIVFVTSVMLVFLVSKKDAIVNVFCFAIIYIVYKVIENFLYDIVKEKQKVIKSTKRFTHKNSDTGAIEVKREDLQEAILYLYEIENQIALRR